MASDYFYQSWLGVGKTYIYRPLSPQANTSCSGCKITNTLSPKHSIRFSVSAEEWVWCAHKCIRNNGHITTVRHNQSASTWGMFGKCTPMPHGAGWGVTMSMKVSDLRAGELSTSSELSKSHELKKAHSCSFVISTIITLKFLLINIKMEHY